VSGTRSPTGPVVPPRVTLITLGVESVTRSTAFYEALGWPRSTASVEGVVSFFQLGANVLAVWSRDALAREALIPVGTPGAVAFAINVASDDEVDATIAAAAEAGATVLRPPADALEFNGRSGYFADPDGHPWEIAHNPSFPLDEHGQVTLP
jgi:predicted lactoylglutathione lyase